MITIRFHIALLPAILATCAVHNPAQAERVSVEDIFSRHKVYVATTEKPESIEAYVRDWRTLGTVVLPASEIAKYRAQDVLVIAIDRSKSGELPALVEDMCPLKSSEIRRDEIVVYAAIPVTGENTLHRKNRLTVLISAPDQKWLLHTLVRIRRKPVLAGTFDPRGEILDRFSVLRLRVAHTSADQLVRDWMSLQRGETHECEWTPFAWNEFVPDPADTRPVVLLFDRQKIDEKKDPAVSLLPKDMRSWLSGDSSRSEIALERQSTVGENGRQLDVWAAVAPSQRLLEVALLEKSRSMWEFPQQCKIIGLADLRPHKRLIVVARAGNRSDKSKNDLVNDLGGKITTALGSIGAGFQCESRQDLGEAVWASEMEEKKPITKRDSLAVELVQTEGLALAVADLTAATSHTQYAVKSIKCLTPPLKQFDKPQPTEPKRPNPDELTGGRSGVKKYPDGIKDPKFKDDLLNWQRLLMPQYEEQVRQWAADRDAYEAQRATRQIDWAVDIDALESASVAGNLRIYDLQNYRSLDACRILYSCDIAGVCEARSPFKSDHIAVTGEQTRPSADLPAAKGSADPVVISEAISKACRDAADLLRCNALLPVDRAQE